jgi:hypothetical protein
VGTGLKASKMTRDRPVAASGPSFIGHGNRCVDGNQRRTLTGRCSDEGQDFVIVPQPVTPKDTPRLATLDL